MLPKLKRARWSLLAVVMALALMGAQMTALAQSDGPYDLTWNTLDSSGPTVSRGGNFELTGTTGQVDAAGAPYPQMATPPGGHSGGIFRILFGGFWQPLRPGTLEVHKRVTPVDDASIWLIDVNGPTAFTATVASDGGTEPRMVATGAYTISESAGVGSFAPNYTAAYSCTVNGQRGPSGDGATINVDVAADRDVVCTFANARRTRTLTVTKVLTPTTDAGRFIMHAHDNAGVEAGHGALVTATVYVSATTFFSETAGIGSDLTRYATTYACDDPAQSRGTDVSGSLSMPDADVTCVFTNTRKAHVLTVTKALSPTSDDGLFVLHVDDKSGIAAGHGAQITAALDVSATVHFSETAGIGADLANYTTVYACDHGNIAGETTSGSLTMPDVDVTCIFTNTRKTRTLTVTKVLSPTSDTGRFAMYADGSTGVEADHGALVTATIDVSAMTQFGETAGVQTDLANYATTYTCDHAGTTGSGPGGSLIMPDADVSCVFTNTRKTHTLTVMKSLIPTNDVGRFLMHAGSSVGVAAGHGAIVTATVEAGETISFSEIADEGTSLADYITAFTCDDPNNTQGVATAGSLSMPDADITCTFTNTRRIDQTAELLFLPMVAR